VNGDCDCPGDGARCCECVFGARVEVDVDKETGVAVLDGCGKVKDDVTCCAFCSLLVRFGARGIEDKGLVIILAD